MSELDARGRPLGVAAGWLGFANTSGHAGVRRSGCGYGHTGAVFTAPFHGFIHAHFTVHIAEIFGAGLHIVAGRIVEFFAFLIGHFLAWIWFAAGTRTHEFVFGVTFANRLGSVGHTLFDVLVAAGSRDEVFACLFSAWSTFAHIKVGLTDALLLVCLKATVLATAGSRSSVAAWVLSAHGIDH